MNTIYWENIELSTDSVFTPKFISFLRRINLIFRANSKNSNKGYLFLKTKNITSKNLEQNFIENIICNRFIHFKICLKKNDRRYKYIDSTDFSKSWKKNQT
ncbi:hypothetical protein LEP1GSC037_0652 [Leptospira interrogans str. 2006001854]|uniref:Uncharacterized protein n=1 Tax=Leptospira interrogans str. 2006001854 TaxID=1001590 RepID=M6GHN4_LEPIR|nr:hypothetical protein LEP1GSC037_0652 [Leptospira interrogans str. 2006001854]OQM26887.1 hypothetical protein DV38_21380 [Leptospira interrogans]